MWSLTFPMPGGRRSAEMLPVQKTSGGTVYDRPVRRTAPESGGGFQGDCSLKVGQYVTWNQSVDAAAAGRGKGACAGRI